ncbi:MAG: heparinase II/III family protein [Acidobacteria bacterium]|nr:heparinase II/III family protein [Acidobacteriota bacterium]
MLRKLKGRSLTELRVRGGQAAASLAERSGLSTQARIPPDASFFRSLDASRTGDARMSAASLLEHFRARPAANFFAAFDAPAETRALLRSRFGGRAGELLVERAERIVAGRFSLLGLHDLNFGDPIDWRLEPLAGKRSPLAHWSRINYLDAQVAGDKKITWELNRQQYFQVLGRAYWHTGDERYAETFARHLHDWTEANPPKLGINWASSLEVAFRAISWLWSLRFFKDSPHLSPALYLRALKFLHAHARHLETYLSTYFSPNTHLTGEALGLFYLGTQLPEFRAAARWRKTGASILLRQLKRHVRPDGVYFEQSSYYHRYTTDFYLHFLLLLKAGGAPRESVLEEKLTALLDHLMHITLPDGTTPLFGDDDGGRLAWLDERPADDFRATLATGASLFKRADYKFVAAAATEETLWLAGARGLSEFDELAAVPPAEGSRAFADGGYYVMRDGWTAGSNCLLIDCGPHGSLNGAHAHADALSLVTVASHGRTVLVDSGTYTYTGSPAQRDEFRATAAHNTLTIDGQSSSVAESAFRWRQTARAACRVWLSRPRFDLFEGEHDGYLRLPAPATHARSILFLKGDYWIVRDRVASVGAHDYALHFHFAPRSAPSIETAQPTPFVREGEGESPGLTLYTFARAGAWRRHDELVSACYGSAVRAPVCTFAFSGQAEETVTLLWPRAAHEEAGRVSAREIEAVGGRAFELTDGATRDFLLLRAADAPTVETARLTSGFGWTWLRFRGDEDEPQELIAIDGQTLRMDGREMLRPAAPTGYLAARRAGRRRWHVESDTGENLFLAPPGAEESLFVGGAPPHDEQRGESLLVSSGE